MKYVCEKQCHRMWPVWRWPARQGRMEGRRRYTYPDSRMDTNSREYAWYIFCCVHYKVKIGWCSGLVQNIDLNDDVMKWKRCRHYRFFVRCVCVCNADLLCFFDVIPNKLSTNKHTNHYSDVIMSVIASQTVCPGANQRKYQRSASLAFVRGIHRWSVNSPHKGPVTRKMFPFDDVIMMAGDLRLSYDTTVMTNAGKGIWRYKATMN